MIQLLTKVNIIDNSGGVVGRCIKILKPHGRDYAKVGDIILVSIKETAKIDGKKKSSAANNLSIRDSNKIKKGSIFKALVVRTKSNYVLKTASFDENSVVLLKSSSSTNSGGRVPQWFDVPPIGTRIKGPISALLTAPINTTNSSNYPKITALSKDHL